MYEKQKVGSEGECLACKYLIKNKYKIIERNFRCRQDEIDIIAYDYDSLELVFFEVKTRTNFYYGLPSEAVNIQKQRHIMNSIKYYLYCNKIEDVYVRIDVIEIVFYKGKYKLNHLKSVM